MSTMKRTLTAPECLAHFFKTREKFNAGIVRDYARAERSHYNFMGCRVTFCRYLLKSLPERIAMTEFLLEHETMTGSQFADCMEGREIGEATAVSLFDDHKDEA